MIPNKNDLSVIAEAADQRIGGKTYMSLTATAVARKEAINVELKQRRQDCDKAQASDMKQQQ